MPKEPTPSSPTRKPKAARAEHLRDTEPVRTCVGCRRRSGREDLLRITRAHGSVIVGGPSSGRGAWLCRDIAAPECVDAGCLATALDRRGFERTWRGSLSDEERTALAGLALRTAEPAERPDAP